MHDNQRANFVDELLDASLVRWPTAGPRGGLEERVLARLRTERRIAPWAARAWAMCAGLAGMLMIGIYVAQKSEQRPATPSAVQSADPRKPETRAAISQPGVVEPIGSQRRAGRAAARGISRMFSPAGKRAREETRSKEFPTPAPLSEQERLLMSYAKLALSPGKLAFHSTPSATEKIEIQPLKIQLLEGVHEQGTRE